MEYKDKDEEFRKRVTDIESFTLLSYLFSVFIVVLPDWKNTNNIQSSAPELHVYYPYMLRPVCMGGTHTCIPVRMYSPVLHKQKSCTNTNIR
jgi:hypothetical protein